MMKDAVKMIMLLVSASSGLYSQEDRDVKLDTPQARVLTHILASAQPIALPDGPMNRVLVFGDTGRITIRSQSGKVEKIDVREGDAQWVPAGSPHTVENSGGSPIRLFDIELRNKPQGPAPVAKLDPTVVDSRHYKIEFENDQVRVLRVHYGPEEKGVVHEHILNRVVCYLNDQGRTKAGDVRIAGAATHTEENMGKQPADRIAVELK